MKLYEYEIEKKLCTVSFDNFQVIVIALIDKNGNRYNGIGVCPAPWIGWEYLFDEFGDSYQPMLIQRGRACKLCNFLEEVLTGHIPSEVSIETDGPNFRLTIRQYTENWHGGGGYKGRVDFSRSKILSMLNNVTIARDSLTNFKDSLIKLYGLEERIKLGAKPIKKYSFKA